MPTPALAFTDVHNDESDFFYLVRGMTDRQRRVRFLLIVLKNTLPNSPAFEPLRQQLRAVEEVNAEVP